MMVVNIRFGSPHHRRRRRRTVATAVAAIIIAVAALVGKFAKSGVFGRAPSVPPATPSVTK